MTTHILDPEYPCNPLIETYQPRVDVVDRLQKFGQVKSGKFRPDLNALEIEKLFTAFSTAALHSSQTTNPNAFGKTKPVNKKVLELLMNWLHEVPKISKGFNETYDMEKEITVIVDQVLNHPAKEYDAVGNFIILLPLRKPANGEKSHRFRW